MRGLRITGTVLLGLLLPVAVGALAPVPRDTDRLTGFDPESTLRQKNLEALFLEVPSPDSSRRHHTFLTREPHVAGQESQLRLARYVKDHFEASGIETELVEYHVYLSTPRKIKVTLLEPERVELDLAEEGFALDPDTYSSRVLPPFHAYSPSGRVEAEVVYANYGLPEDYRQLERLGVDVKGKIVLVRYGKSFRGVKVRVAEERGAAGVLIYSDPFDDGYFQGPVYPEGPYRPGSAVQRGSVQYIFVRPGDPLTPGVAARKAARRISPELADNLPSIPSQPLSYRGAEKILRRLGGDPVPPGWQGALPFAYRVGPGPSKVRLHIEMDFAVRPIYNVIGRIPGESLPEEWVILGNHLDAWGFGGVDPGSGTTALLEVASGLGRLLEQDFRPRRTLILAGWDGEEYGLIGSTEWGEEFREELKERTVGYLNVDSAVSGSRFSVSAVPSLHRIIREATRSVSDPESGRSVYEVWSERDARDRGPQKEEPLPGDLGSGSDYTVFLGHLGIPSLNMSFTGPYGVYHSLYDNHFWMNRFGDPEWKYHPTMARLWGLLALRLANADVLAYDFEAYGEAVLRHVESLGETFHEVPGLQVDWPALLREGRETRRLGAEISDGLDLLLRKPMHPARARRINALFLQAERRLLLEKGLPGRPWYRHSIYAPGLYTGYAAQPLPGVAQALEDGQLTVAALQADELVTRLRELNLVLDQIRRLTR